MVTSTFLWGVSGYIWINILTYDPWGWHHLYADWKFHVNVMLPKLFLVKMAAILDTILDSEKFLQIWEWHPDFFEGSCHVTRKLVHMRWTWTLPPPTPPGQSRTNNHLQSPFVSPLYMWYQARSQTFLCGGSNWSNFGTFYDYAWITLRLRWIWPFWGGSDDPPDPPPLVTGLGIVSDLVICK